MELELSKEAMEFLATPRILDASDPKVNGSYTNKTKWVSDEDHILMLKPNIINLGSCLSVYEETDEYEKKVNNFWTKFKKTEKGKNAFPGPILSLNYIDMNLPGTDDLVDMMECNTATLLLKLITYPEFFAAYGPEFSLQEKQRSYSIGTNSIVKSSDDSFIFGVRSPLISSAGGIYESIGGFLSIDKLLEKKDAEYLRAVIKAGEFREKINDGTLESQNSFAKTEDINDVFNLEKYEELGLKKEDINKVTYLAVTRKDLYLNYNIFLLAETNLESGKIIESAKKWGDGELSRAFAVPVEKLNDWILANKNEITPTLKSIIRCYYLSSE